MICHGKKHFCEIVLADRHRLSRETKVISSPLLNCNKSDQDTQLNCSVVCIFLVHVALQDFQFVLASAQARNYAPMHQIRPRHAAEFQRGM